MPSLMTLNATQIQGAAWITQAPTVSSRFAYPANLLDICLHLDVQGHINVAQAELEEASRSQATAAAFATGQR